MRPSRTTYNNFIVITRYCNGKPLDQIAKETSLSKGSVYNVVKHWKDSLGNAGIEEIREFAIIVNKEGMTIQECAQGFRIAQILKALRINDEFEERNNLILNEIF
jgi:Mor family transcriptional regulator